MRERPLLVFFHLRKTAGMTVRFVMARQFRRDAILTLDDWPTVEEANRIWNAIPADRRARIECVQGHLAFGTELFAPRATICFTMLRDPVERVVSQYYYDRRQPETRFHTALNRDRLTLEQFVSDERFAEIHNMQTRTLAGVNANASPEELLDAALGNLRDRIAMVGVSERLDESLLVCRAVFGWRRLIYRHANVTPRRPRLDAIAPETLAAIERANSLDRVLYRFACALLDQAMRKYRITDAEVNALRRASRVYSATRRMLGLPREAWHETQKAIARRRIVINR
ncbi:MAG TPA: hypothetical protein VKR29_05190 [Candidatus Binataceae bacterium]|nr:hypothetical protein [Candidatus Binataceae bacterium]